MEAAQKEVSRIETALKQTEVKAQLADVSLEAEIKSENWQKFLDAMNDDLNTPNAYKEIFETVKELNQGLRVREIDWKNVASVYQTIRKMLEVLGIYINQVVLSAEDKDIYQKWNEAKSQKDFETADKYRAQLQERGII